MDGSGGLNQRFDVGNNNNNKMSLCIKHGLMPCRLHLQTLQQSRENEEAFDFKKQCNAGQKKKEWLQRQAVEGKLRIDNQGRMKIQETCL